MQVVGQFTTTFIDYRGEFSTDTSDKLYSLIMQAYGVTFAVRDRPVNKGQKTKQTDQHAAAQHNAAAAQDPAAEQDDEFNRVWKNITADPQLIGIPESGTPPQVQYSGQ